jgi:hypothetical protein
LRHARAEIQEIEGSKNDRHKSEDRGQARKLRA